MSNNRLAIYGQFSSFIDLAMTGLRRIASNPAILGRALEALGISMPNVEVETMGGTVFWIDLETERGWRLQQNIITGHCRILDPNDYRKAWGGESHMTRIFREVMSE